MSTGTCGSRGRRARSSCAPGRATRSCAPCVAAGSTWWTSRTTRTSATCRTCSCKAASATASSWCRTACRTSAIRRSASSSRATSWRSARSSATSSRTPARRRAGRVARSRRGGSVFRLVTHEVVVQLRRVRHAARRPRARRGDDEGLHLRGRRTGVRAVLGDERDLVAVDHEVAGARHAHQARDRLHHQRRVLAPGKGARRRCRQVALLALPIAARRAAVARAREHEADARAARELLGEAGKAPFHARGVERRAGVERIEKGIRPGRDDTHAALLVGLRVRARSEEHTSELQSPCNLVCRLLLEKKKKKKNHISSHKKKNTKEHKQ